MLEDWTRSLEARLTALDAATAAILKEVRYATAARIARAGEQVCDDLWVTHARTLVEIRDVERARRAARRVASSRPPVLFDPATFTETEPEEE